MKTRRTGFLTAIIVFPVMLFFSTAVVAVPDEPHPDLTELNIEELANLEVTSVARKPQKISHSAAAVYVITSEDIRRSGATCIPEALRMVPGLNVAKINTNLWAVSARGFNGTYANKLLVLIDGRTIYSPIFSGVFWQAEDTLLEDIDRIEIIRGPGASLWGANAVNGIINIITKHSRDTKGGFISTGLGTEERAFLNTRYGGTYKENGNYRLYARGLIRDESRDINDDPAGDDYYKIQTGFRTDKNLSDANDLTLQGDIHKSEENAQYSIAVDMPPLYRETTPAENTYIGGNILGRWTHTSPKVSDLSLQIYYDMLSISSLNYSLNTNIIDMDFQHRFQAGRRQEIIWGAGYRFYSDDNERSDYVSFDPENQVTHLYSAFLQDEITLIENRLFFTIGSKIEHHEYTGFEYQPNARMLWAVNDRHTLWGAVSRAVRCPSRGEHDISTILQMIPPSTGMNPSPLPAKVTYLGNKDITSEILIAYELGYRMQTNFHISFDMAVFYNLYDDTVGTVINEPYIDASSSYLIAPVMLENILKGDTRGGEFSLWWIPFQNLRLQTIYTYIDINLEVKDTETAENIFSMNTYSPSHQLSFNTGINLPWHLEADIWLRYVDKIPDVSVESYTTMDVHFAWKPSTSLTLTIVGRNLFDETHVEFIEETGRIGITRVERSVYAGILWTF